ncbi:hypothetical protein AB1Y20_007249 [Prymnesium parvum]|uniref:Uncharacterized protein n=1 Tax=Prymnesium parvum TaxID=97485 RepID=A0AB34IUX2_PRYPA
MRTLVLLLLLHTAAARENLCFTAHAKGELHCREPPVNGRAVAVYDSGASPQRARFLFFAKGKLCEDRHCRRCLANDAAEWVRCNRARPFMLRTMEANGDLPRKYAILFVLLVLSVPVVALLMGLRRGKKSDDAPVQPQAGTEDGNANLEVVSSILGFATSWWFPWVAALGTGMNMFTLVFTAATVVLFLTAVLARPGRWASTALINAFGAAVGTWLMLAMIRGSNDPLEYLEEVYPSVLANPAWQKAMGYMQSYGTGGMLLVASLPIFLHPIVLFGLLAQMSNAEILLIVMTGRTVKYLVMARVTLTAPHLLRFFGIKTAIFDAANKAARKLE